ncbi:MULTISPECIES: hypothetical protein [unclassified Herbaspirillum]|uniref:hypothetical protein n=1 Tax=unclassified Herbaspirillum TaxID=2624150 RepID=UPI0025808E26|nr:MULTISPECIES: hypothetical protein [unclassified Herbaspirillum]|tara:strand:+ start:759 stop:1277 length:519 start_codon:yes stop_codon:yes gene_type:complete
MAYRPYFKHGIEQIQELVASSHGDLKTLKAIQYELGFRDRPKARSLKIEVDELVLRLSTGTVMPPTNPSAPIHQPPKFTASERGDVPPSQAFPDRVIVECANCQTPNFVSTLDSVVQHLSCSVCKSTYEAQFKYGVMRTTFQTKSTNESGSANIKWILMGLAVLVIIVLMTK